MLIGVPKEIKSDEYRVAVTPAGTETLTSAGHQVLIEAGAGLGSGFPDDSYVAAGAEIGLRGRRLGPGGDGHEGQGAHRVRMAENS
jgi:alanine dehydrogenase